MSVKSKNRRQSAGSYLDNQIEPLLKKRAKQENNAKTDECYSSYWFEFYMFIYGGCVKVRNTQPLLTPHTFIPIETAKLGCCGDDRRWLGNVCVCVCLCNGGFMEMLKSLCRTLG